MTREKAKEILISTLRDINSDDDGFEYTTEQFTEAMLIAIEAFSEQSHLPEGLEEAAEKHISKVFDAVGHPGWDWEMQDVLDAFKAGAKWRDAQIPKLPDNLEEAAEEYRRKACNEACKNSFLDNHPFPSIKTVFIAGAEWGMNQMFTIKYNNEPLDSAARKTFEKWIPMEILEYNGLQMPLYNQGALIMMFDAGAKWQAEQGESYTAEVIMLPVGIKKIQHTVEGFEPGEEVIVQIQKK